MMNFVRIFYIVLFILLLLFVILIELLLVINTTYQYKEYCDTDLPIEIIKGDKTDENNKQPLLYVINSSCSVFSDTYTDARYKFRHAVNELQKFIQHQNHSSDIIRQITLDQKIILSRHEMNDKHNQQHGTTKNDDDDYTMDIAVLHGTVPGLVVHVSGVHGVEGYAGSAIQITFLHMLLHILQNYGNNQNQKMLMPPSLPTIVFIHSFNPYGMATYRRTNENNVDLNRNALTDDQWKTYANEHHYNKPSYEQFDALFFNPVTQPTFLYAYVVYWLKASYVLMKYGLPKLKATMVGGQYHNPYGIFYGGKHIENSIIQLQNWWNDFFLRSSSANDIFNVTHPHIATVWIDVHTGLGPLGIGTLLPLSDELISSQYFCDQLQTWYPTSINGIANHKKEHKRQLQQDEGNEVYQGYEQVQGFVPDYFFRSYFQHQRKALFFTQEFGTIPTPLVGHAMIIENAAHQYYHRLYRENEKCDRNDHASNECYIQWRMLYHEKYCTRWWAKHMTSSAFYPQNQEWRNKILQDGINVLFQSISRTIQLSTTTSSTTTENDITYYTADQPPRPQLLSSTHEGSSRSNRNESWDETLSNHDEL